MRKVIFIKDFELSLKISERVLQGSELDLSLICELVKILKQVIVRTV